MGTKFIGVLIAVGVVAAVAALVASSIVADGGQVRAHEPEEPSGQAEVQDSAPQPDQEAAEVQTERNLPPDTIPVQIVGIDVVEPVRADGVDLSFSLDEFEDRANFLYVNVELDSGERFEWSSRSPGADHVPGRGLVMLEMDDEFHGWLEGPNYSLIGLTDESQLRDREIRARLMTVGGEPYEVDGVPVETTVRISLEQM